MSSLEGLLTPGTYGYPGAPISMGMNPAEWKLKERDRRVWVPSQELGNRPMTPSAIRTLIVHGLKNRRIVTRRPSFSEMSGCVPRAGNPPDSGAVRSPRDHTPPHRPTWLE
jgi:hypothetical protein